MYYIKSTKYSIRERQTKKNGKVYDCIFRIIDESGKESRKVISGCKTKAEAKFKHDQFITGNCSLINTQQHQDILQSVEKAKKVAQAVEAAKEKVFALEYERYLLAMRNVNAESSVLSKTSVYTLYLKPYFGEMAMQDITTGVIYQWLDTIYSAKSKSGKPFSYKYTKKIYGDLRAFYSWYSLRNDVENPMQRVKLEKKKPAPKKIEIWTSEEFKKFIDVVDNPVLKAYFATLFFTGMRKGEITALQVEDVNLPERYLVVNKTYTRKTIDGYPMHYILCVFRSELHYILYVKWSM